MGLDGRFQKVTTCWLLGETIRTNKDLHQAMHIVDYEADIRNRTADCIFATRLAELGENGSEQLVDELVSRVQTLRTLQNSLKVMGPLKFRLALKKGFPDCIHSNLAKLVDTNLRLAETCEA